jgi:septum formation protein
MTRPRRRSTPRSPAAPVAEGPAGLVLASGSPRRHELLTSIGLSFTVEAADIDESVSPGEEPKPYVLRLARAKALHVAAAQPDGTIVIGADTTVEVDGAILAKPADADDAAAMLRTLSGRTHQVHTGMAVAVAGEDDPWAHVTTTTVTFAALDHATVAWYVGTGEPFGKAGAYAIQGVGGALVASVDGNVQNVVGLPLADLVANPAIAALLRARVTS